VVSSRPVGATAADGGLLVDSGLVERVRELVAAVPDPEVPVLSIDDLGVLRSVEAVGDAIVVTITPTYSGCPAMQHIEQAIMAVIEQVGVRGEVRTVFDPAWTTEWMSPQGRAKLIEYGIAAPNPATATVVGETAIAIRGPVRCPQCGSTRTQSISEFGSTACKALYRCTECLEPFDYFKELL
jgi:ring-1,2-phenylacetyl-CoA epoxidase subunit PaaD